MKENALRWEAAPDGTKYPVPFPCGACGAPSSYGKDDAWYCTDCWVRREEDERERLREGR